MKEIVTAMSDQAWVFLGIMVTQFAVVLVAVVGGHYKMKSQKVELASQRVDVTDAKDAAERAAKQTEATGNGFAKRVEATLSSISEKLAETNEAVKSNRADLKALRSEAQADRQVVIRHLEGHLRSGSTD